MASINILASLLEQEEEIRE